MTATSAQKSMNTIDQFISQMGKTAADPLSEPGSIGGETSHPVKKVDDRLEKAKEGERSAENARDVKADVGPPSVESTPEAKAAQDKSLLGLASRFAAGAAGGQQKKAEGGAVSTPGSAADDTVPSPLKVAPTGDDPKSETSSAKAGKEDPGSTHPARTDNTSLDGHKYAVDANTTLEQLAVMMKAAGDNVCAGIASIMHDNGRAPAPAATKQAAAAAPVPQGITDPALAQQVGWEMAGLLSGNFDKRAADSMVAGLFRDIIKEASDDADRLILFMDTTKRAEAPPMDPLAGGGGGGGGAPPPPMGGGGGGPPGGGDPASMMAALGGGEGGGGAPPPMGGGMGGGMGGAPGGEGGVQLPPGMDEQQLGQILESLGITQEELDQALAAEQGGGAGGGAGGDPLAGGGAPPPMGSEPGGEGGGAPPPKIAADKNGQQHQIKNAEVRNYITELVTRSRQKRASARAA